MKKIITITKFFIAFSILFVLFYKIGFKNIIETFKDINLLFVLIYLIFFFIFLLLGSLNIKLLINATNKEIRFIKIIKYCFLSWSIGLFVPGKVGEFSLIYFLKKENVPIGKGTVICIMDKLITVTVTSLIAVVGFFIFFSKNDISILIFSLVLLFLLFIFSLTEKGRSLIKKYILKRYAIKFKGFSKTLFYLLKKRVGILFLNFSLTIVRLIVVGITYLIMFLSLGQNINLTYIIMIYAIGIIVSLIPVTPSGLGVREAAAVLLYSRVGVLSEVTITVYLFFNIINYLIASVSLLICKD